MIIKILKRIREVFLNILGDIKVYKYPMFIVYDPGSYNIDGYKSRLIINSLEPGDIICRRYSMYLDSYFIPGKYSHSSIYIGNNKVIHAVSDGVVECDILEFIRCDGIIVLRPVDGQSEAINTAKLLLDKDYDYDFTDDNDKYYCHEFVATCYSMLKFKKLTPKWLLGLIKAKPRYLADSFIRSDKVDMVIEV